MDREGYKTPSRLTPFNQLQKTLTMPYKDPEKQREADDRWREATLRRSEKRTASGVRPTPRRPARRTVSGMRQTPEGPRAEPQVACGQLRGGPRPGGRLTRRQS